MVQLLGEFIFANSSSGRSIKRLDQNVGDATVRQLLEHLGKDDDVDKMQVHSIMIQSPSVRRAKEEVNTIFIQSSEASFSMNL